MRLPCVIAIRLVFNVSLARLEQFVWSDLEENRKMPEKLLGGPSCLETSPKIWIFCVDKVKLQIRIKINERKKSEEAKQSI